MKGDESEIIRDDIMFNPRAGYPNPNPNLSYLFTRVVVHWFSPSLLSPKSLLSVLLNFTKPVKKIAHPGFEPFYAL
jgi:hypothetical protein